MMHDEKFPPGYYRIKGAGGVILRITKTDEEGVWGKSSRDPADPKPYWNYDGSYRHGGVPGQYDIGDSYQNAAVPFIEDPNLGTFSWENLTEAKAKECRTSSTK